MKQELAVTQSIGIQDLMNISDVFAKSGMFSDAKQAAQVFVKIQAGQEMGIPPFAAVSGVHIIQGKPTIGAGLMAARIKASGKYNYKVVEQSDKKCSIDFYEGKEMIGNSTFTIEDAKKAGTKNLDKFPKNMLFARAISNGVKWYCPDIFSSPVYVPEEMQSAQEDVTEDVPHEEVKDEPKVEKVDWDFHIMECKTKEELSAVWKDIPKEYRTDYLAKVKQKGVELEGEAA